MSGFASVTRESATATVSVTLRALNHRFLDLQVRVPASLSDVEPGLRALVQQRVSRGRVELGVSAQFRRAPAVDVELNEQFGAALAATLDLAREQGLIDGPLTPGDLLRLPQALTIRERSVEREEGAINAVAGLTLATAEDALTQLDEMRVTEGAHLYADLDGRRMLVASLVEQIAGAAQDGRAALQERLALRVQELKGDLQIDPSAIALEVVRFAARSDISEELSRFRGHVAHWQALTAAAEPCGRKLDFLLQEMNREVNTMGSKADGLDVSRLVVAAKAELEKMKEQVQNVE